MNIYVGNLPYTLSDDELRSLFEAYGEVTRAQVVMDKFSGRSKGFAFVEMTNNSEGNEAIQKLNDQDIKGRKLRVNEARPKESNPSRSFSR
jgi:RNA recognition motif-containing protein